MSTYNIIIMSFVDEKIYLSGYPSHLSFIVLEVSNIFLFLNKNARFGYSLEVPR